MTWRQVAPGVLVTTSAVYATSTVAILGNAGYLLVDPGVTADEIAALVSALPQPPVAVWSTHPHWDHLLDGPALAHLPRWGAPAAAPVFDGDAELAAVLATRPDDHAAPLAAPPRGYPGEGEVRWDGPRVVVLAHRAHAPAHTALHLPEARLLVAGDMLSDVEIPLLDLDASDPVADYRAGLSLLESTGAELVVPGHGGLGTLSARVEADRAYLDSLDEPARDPRLSVPWLREIDARQRALVT
ncbi:MBL fold metallo-hydrolase [Cellulomonas edaphi]|uniref:MBL fold metallo-hydrolase n=1 Tax=Cellulomonas edaphi TaxID=3053468 RepID=A0ABT7S782_9CELL|nr:MBL fold metallo-hydrolase [Cellulomons edaphi]MDM7831475.1 MBL fold metallo-hydrolase [Cellulomons edaphi]